MILLSKFEFFLLFDQKGAQRKKERNRKERGT